MAIAFSMLTDSPHNSGFLYASFEARHRFDDLTITGSTLKPVHKVDVQEDQVSFTLGGRLVHEQFRSWVLCYWLQSQLQAEQEAEALPKCPGFLLEVVTLPAVKKPVISREITGFF
ncbi:MAG: hypothetical protein ACR2PT_02815 [Endozoicomonas sp.]